MPVNMGNRDNKKKKEHNQSSKKAEIDMLLAFHSDAILNSMLILSHYRLHIYIKFQHSLDLFCPFQTILCASLNRSNQAHPRSFNDVCKIRPIILILRPLRRGIDNYI
jgi:hypothetical protein